MACPTPAAEEALAVHKHRTTLVWGTETAALNKLKLVKHSSKKWNPAQTPLTSEWRNSNQKYSWVQNSILVHYTQYALCTTHSTLQHTVTLEQHVIQITTVYLQHFYFSRTAYYLLHHQDPGYRQYPVRSFGHILECAKTPWLTMCPVNARHALGAGLHSKEHFIGRTQD